MTNLTAPDSPTETIRADQLRPGHTIHMPATGGLETVTATTVTGAYVRITTDGTGPGSAYQWPIGDMVDVVATAAGVVAAPANADLRTPDEWQRITGVTILDADGWTDRDWTDPIGISEWQRRMSASTVATRATAQLTAERDRAVRERDSLARRCALRYEEAEKLRAELAEARSTPPPSWAYQAAVYQLVHTVEHVVAMWPERMILTRETHDVLAARLAKLVQEQALFNAPPPATTAVLAEIAAERARQDARWGQQNHPDGTGPRVAFAGRLCYMTDAAKDARRATEAAAGRIPGLEHHGPLTWRHILREEVFEALAEADPVRLRAELVQVAAVAANWVEALDRRAPAEPTDPADESEPNGHVLWGGPDWSIDHPADCDPTTCPVAQLARQDEAVATIEALPDGRWAVSVNDIGDRLLLGDRLDIPAEG